MGNYNFKDDIKREKQINLLVLKYLKDKNIINDFNIRQGNYLLYDAIIKRNMKKYKVELKEDLLCCETGNLAIEYKCRNNPSGISITKSDAWITIIPYKVKNKTEIFFTNTFKLKKFLELKNFKKVFMGDFDINENRKVAEGFLVPRNILSSISFIFNVSSILIEKNGIYKWM